MNALKRERDASLVVDRPGRILVVDDDAAIRRLVFDVLRRAGHVVECVESAELAHPRLDDVDFDLVVVDLGLPGQDGEDFLREALRANPDLVAVVMTGQGSVRSAVDCMKTGAFDYLQKPFPPSALLGVIERGMEVRRLRTENIQLRETVAIYELTNQVAFCLDPSAVMETVMDAAVRETGADEVSIMLPTRDGGALSVAAARGHESSIVGRRIALDRSIAGWVASNREPVILEGEVRDSRFTPVVPRPEIRTACCVPMLARGRLVGVMSINLTRGRRPLTRGQKKALHVVAGIAASALESAVQHEETRRRVTQLQSLRAIDTAIAAGPELRVTMDVFLDQVARNLGVEAACVRVLDAESRSLGRVSSRGMGGRAAEDRAVAVGEGHCGCAAQIRRVVAVPDLHADPAEYAGTALAEDFEGYHAVPLVSKSRVKGVLELFHAGPPPSEREWLDFLETLCGQAAIAIENAGMFADLVRSRDDLASAYETTLEGWSRALDLRDKETEGHTRRVTAMSDRLAREMRIQGQDLVHVRRGALLHDIGKMGIPDAVLLKPGALDDEEWRIMRRHPEYARDLLEPIPYLRDALDIPYCHHERWDGNGYPRGLAGEEIPLAARIFSPIDVFDALTSDRPYRPAWSREKALAHIEAGAGTMFDPRVVKAFLAVDWSLEEL